MAQGLSRTRLAATQHRLRSAMLQGLERIPPAANLAWAASLWEDRYFEWRRRAFACPALPYVLGLKLQAAADAIRGREQDVEKRSPEDLRACASWYLAAASLMGAHCRPRDRGSRLDPARFMEATEAEIRLIAAVALHAHDESPPPAATLTDDRVRMLQRHPADLARDLALFVERKPAWVCREGPHAGYPFTWGHYRLGMMEIIREDARRRIDRFNASRIAFSLSPQPNDSWLMHQRQLAQMG